VLSPYLQLTGNSTVFKIMIRTALLFLAALFFNAACGQDKICRTWYTDGKASAIEIYRGADGVYTGRIVWMRDDLKNGKPMLDTENPDASKRNRRWLGLQIITGLSKKSETEYVSGKIYDPQRGHYYDCKMTLKNDKTLELRGYILGLPFLGRTTTWTLKETAAYPAGTAQTPSID
jgi:uncharacterized protein (DUF2147 family)